MRKIFATVICISSLIAAPAFATTGYYIAGNAGIFQGNFNQRYLDQTDLIIQNIQQTVQQNGYTGGVAIGYSHKVAGQFLLGAELDSNWDTNQSTFQSGSSSSAFSDVIQIKNHIDLTVVP